MIEPPPRYPPPVDPPPVDSHDMNARRPPVRTDGVDPPLQQPEPPAPRFSWSSSLLTMATIIGCFVILCSYASDASTLFALTAARPMYALYPSIVAAMLVGGLCAFICYLPTMLAVLCFQALFDTDIRKNHTPPPGVPAAAARATGQGGPGESSQGTRYIPLVFSLLRDGANTIKLALVLTPIYVMAVGRGGDVVVESKSLEAAAGGQLAAAIMTLRIMLVGMREIWDLVPLVVLRWDRDAQNRRG